MMQSNPINKDSASIFDSNKEESCVEDVRIDCSPHELARIIRKLDVRIIPFLGVLYLCSFLDRVNISNAKLAGITGDLHLSDSDYNIALSIFFVGYVLFEVPSNMMLKFIGPNKWIPIVMVSWGTVMALMAACHNAAGLLAARFFLGVTEAGLFPGIIFYLSLWYTRGEQSTRIALFFSFSTLAGAFGGVMAYGIMQMDGYLGLHGWQWIFIIEAIPTLILSAVTYFVLPSFPEKAKFLTLDERKIIINRLKVDAGPSTETEFSWVEFRSVFTDYKVYIHSLIYICGTIPLYSMSLFLPSIIQGMGFTDLRAQIMSAPPYAIACVVTIAVAMHADRQGERGFHVAFPAMIGAVGYIVLISVSHRGPVARYIATCVAVSGVFAHVPPMLSWITSNIGGHTKRGVATAFIISVGNIGGIIAGQIYRSNDKPYYTRGNCIACALIVCVAIVALVFKYVLLRENRRRDSLTEEEVRIESIKDNLCDKHPDFRYMT
ncbi:major facilitator superfamily domain-containing protein [Pilobolus umbonatus]|nr:major facilitator superfamily domain-containing protein [Pilobolus umbonatus]